MSTLNDYYDCCFTNIREKLKNLYKRHPFLARNASALLVRMTLISMFVVGGLDHFVGRNAVKCGNGTYQMPIERMTSSSYLKFATIMLAFLLIFKCLEGAKIPLPRFLTILFYIFGIIVLWFVPEYVNTTCFDNERMDTMIHPIPGAMDSSKDESKIRRKEKPCATYDKNYALLFLRNELNVILVCCAVSWAICITMFAGYMMQILRGISARANDERIDRRMRLLIRREAALGIFQRGNGCQPQATSRQSSFQRPVQPRPSSSIPIPLCSSISQYPAPPTVQIQSPIESPDTESSVASVFTPGPTVGPENADTTHGQMSETQLSTFSSPLGQPAEGGEKVEAKVTATLDSTTRICSSCGRFQSLRSLRERISSSDDPTKVLVTSQKTPQDDQTPDCPEFCQNCGAEFLYEQACSRL